MRVFLVNGVDEHELPGGETIIGRSLECQIRFNHPSVSRRHLRIDVSDAGVAIEDLGSSNGTYVNNRRIKELTAITDGDSLIIGKRKVGVRVLDGQAPPTDDAALIRPAVLEQPRFITCEACRSTMPPEATRCPHCGRGRRYGVHSRTQVIKMPQDASQLGRRRHTRFPTDLLVFYVSESLSFEARARDLSVSGVFVTTELLDVPGTDCKVTLLPDGYPAVELHGVVRRIAEHKENEPDASGMGVEFISLRHEDRLILANLLMRSQERRRLAT